MVAWWSYWISGLPVSNFNLVWISSPNFSSTIPVWLSISAPNFSSTTVFTKIIGHVGHFRWQGPNVRWEISRIWIEYIKPIGQMSDESWKFFGYTGTNLLLALNINAIIWTNDGLIYQCIYASLSLNKLMDNCTILIITLCGDETEM